MEGIQLAPYLRPCPAAPLGFSSRRLTSGLHAPASGSLEGTTHHLLLHFASQLDVLPFGTAAELVAALFREFHAFPDSILNVFLHFLRRVELELDACGRATEKNGSGGDCRQTATGESEDDSSSGDVTAFKPDPTLNVEEASTFIGQATRVMRLLAAASASSRAPTQTQHILHAYCDLLMRRGLYGQVRSFALGSIHSASDGAAHNARMHGYAGLATYHHYLERKSVGTASTSTSAPASSKSKSKANGASAASSGPFQLAYSGRSSSGGGSGTDSVGAHSRVHARGQSDTASRSKADESELGAGGGSDVGGVKRKREEVGDDGQLGSDRGVESRAPAKRHASVWSFESDDSMDSDDDSDAINSSDGSSTEDKQKRTSHARTTTLHKNGTGGAKHKPPLASSASGGAHRKASEAGGDSFDMDFGILAGPRGSAPAVELLQSTLLDEAIQCLRRAFTILSYHPWPTADEALRSAFERSDGSGKVRRRVPIGLLRAHAGAGISLPDHVFSPHAATIVVSLSEALWERGHHKHALAICRKYWRRVFSCMRATTEAARASNGGGNTGIESTALGEMLKWDGRSAVLRAATAHDTTAVALDETEESLESCTWSDLFLMTGSGAGPTPAVDNCNSESKSPSEGGTAIHSATSASVGSSSVGFADGDAGITIGTSVSIGTCPLPSALLYVFTQAEGLYERFEHTYPGVLRLDGHGTTLTLSKPRSHATAHSHTRGNSTTPSSHLVPASIESVIGSVHKWSNALCVWVTAGCATESVAWPESEAAPSLHQEPPSLSLLEWAFVKAALALACPGALEQ